MAMAFNTGRFKVFDCDRNEYFAVEEDNRLGEVVFVLFEDAKEFIQHQLRQDGRRASVFEIHEIESGTCFYYEPDGAGGYREVMTEMERRVRPPRRPIVQL
jgi:hypothetical protein